MGISRIVNGYILYYIEEKKQQKKPGGAVLSLNGVTFETTLA